MRHFSVNCEVIQNKKIKFYQKKDISLGEYIISKSENKKSICSACKTNQKHVTVLYGFDDYKYD